MTIPENPVTYCELQTSDLARARAFYGELFGWKSQEIQTPMGPYTEFPGQLIGMIGNHPGIPIGWIPYMTVADIAASTKRAKQLGAEIVRDCISIPEGSFSVVRDPTGAVVGLFQKAAAMP